VIEYHGRDVRKPADARSGEPLRWGDATPGGTQRDGGLQAPLDIFADTTRLRLNARAVAILWRAELNQQPKCIATSAFLALSEVIETTSVERRGSASQSRWHWSSSDTGDRLQIDLPLVHGVATVIAEWDASNSRSLIERIIPALIADTTPFLQLWEVAMSAEASASRLQDVANLSAIGIIIVDGDASVLFANDAAERICGESKALRLSGNTVRATTLHDSLRLQTAIEHVVNEGAREGARVPVLALHQTRGRPIMITVNPVQQSTSADKPTAILCIFDSESDVSASVRPACDFYRLSAMESKLAQTMVQGLSITEAANKLGLKEHTARSYLKQVFQKTGTNRQGELVALFLRTSVHCVPNQHMTLVD
jgi:DNA-binding CsgD family transcriptional regulator/PAS domain-containing protein